MSSGKRVQIIPPAPAADGLTPANGTRVLVDGVAIPRVHKVVITAEAGDVWTAAIHVYVSPEDIPACAGVVEVTDFNSTATEHAQAPASAEE